MFFINIRLDFERKAFLSMAKYTEVESATVHLMKKGTSIKYQLSLWDVIWFATDWHTGKYLYLELYRQLVEGSIFFTKDP